MHFQRWYYSLHGSQYNANSEKDILADVCAR